MKSNVRNSVRGFLGVAMIDRELAVKLHDGAVTLLKVALLEGAANQTHDAGPSLLRELRTIIDDLLNEQPDQTPTDFAPIGHLRKIGVRGRSTGWIVQLPKPWCANARVSQRCRGQFYESRRSPRTLLLKIEDGPDV